MATRRHCLTKRLDVMIIRMAHHRVHVRHCCTFMFVFITVTIMRRRKTTAQIRREKQGDRERKRNNVVTRKKRPRPMFVFGIKKTCVDARSPDRGHVGCGGHHCEYCQSLTPSTYCQKSMGSRDNSRRCAETALSIRVLATKAIRKWPLLCPLVPSWHHAAQRARNIAKNIVLRESHTRH